MVLVPKNTIFSARTTSLPGVLEPSQLFSSDASAGLLLTTILLHEFLLGDSGPWWGYLQSLPCSTNEQQFSWGIALPLAWSVDSPEWKAIQHTETGRMVKRAESDPQGRLEGLGMSLVSN